MSGTYTKEEIIKILQDLYKKINRPITSKILIEDENIPTIGVFNRLFGNWKHACEESDIPFKINSRKFDICDAQKELDNRNGNFDILEFTDTRSKAKIKCKKCGYIWKTYTYLLYDKDSNDKGCPNCYEQNCKYIEQLKNNNLIKIKYLHNGKYIFKCIKCNYEFEAYLCNVTNENFHCQNCSAVDDKQYKMIRLLDNSLQSFYILGFLLSDGHFSDTGRIKLLVKQPDKDIIDKIVQYIGIQDSINMEKKAYGFQCMDTYTSQILKRKYEIFSNKTYKPCNISSLQGNEFIAFLIGFIDGDGSIYFRSDTKTPKITIKLHKSWEDNLNYISKTLYKLCNKNNYPKAISVKQKQDIYTSITFCDRDVLKMLYSFIKINNLFCLERKWNKLINITKGEQYE